MSFVAVDDGFPDHPKVAGLSDRAFRVHVSALCYCARYRTEGLIPVSTRSATLRATDRAVRELLEAGVWEEREGQTWIHDYSDFNGSRIQREQARERKRAQRAREASR